MGLAIILRKRAVTNRFRDILLAVCGSGAGDEALICSGFFQELYKTSTYRASHEGNFAQCLANNNVAVTTVGVHNSSWIRPYKNFRNALTTAGVRTTALFVSGLHWHAKVFIYKNKSAPLFGIIGSSNMTRNAFSTSSPFNYESDVFLWEDTHSVLNPIMEQQLSEIEDPDEIIRAPYDPEMNKGLSIPQRLIRLEKEIHSSKMKELQQ